MAGSPTDPAPQYINDDELFGVPVVCEYVSKANAKLILEAVHLYVNLPPRIREHLAALLGTYSFPRQLEDACDPSIKEREVSK